MDFLKYMTAFFLLFTLNAKAQTLGPTIEGVVTGINGNSYTLLGRDHEVRGTLTGLPQIRREEIRRSLANKTNISLPTQNLNILRSFENGLHTCEGQELNYSCADIIANATRSGSFQAFLQNIPQVSLGLFTFVYESRSSQASAVTAQSPRVIRTSSDGRVTMAYTCQNSGEAKVELICFNDNTREFEFKEIAFNANGQVETHHSPESCANCHRSDNNEGRQTMRPNWNEYFSWNGVCGEHDDYVLPRGSRFSIENNFASLDRNAVMRGQLYCIDFLNTRARSNPCYSNLPWPTSTENGFENYPYRTSRREYIEYRDRVNTRMTSNYSNLNLQRLSRQIYNQRENNPDVFNAIFSNQCVPITTGVTMDGTNQNISQFVRNISPLNFNLEFRAGRTEYNMGDGLANNNQLEHYLIQEIIDNNESLSRSDYYINAYRLTLSCSEHYSRVRMNHHPNPRLHQRFCRQLRRLIDSLPAPAPAPTTPVQLAQTLSLDITPTNRDSACRPPSPAVMPRRPDGIASCTGCHSNNGLSIGLEEVSANSADRWQRYMGRIQNSTMPPRGGGYALSEAQKADYIRYFTEMMDYSQGFCETGSDRSSEAESPSDGASAPGASSANPN